MTPSLRYPLEIPPRVARAYALATEVGFGVDGGPSSCLPGIGRVLAVLAAARPGGRIAEIGTGVGAGSAWLASGMDGGSILVTVEVDAERAELARGVLSDDARVTVLTGRWQDRLPALGPFDLVFLDGGYGEHVAEDATVVDTIVDLVVVGGHLVLDDLTAQAELASAGHAGPEVKRELGLRHQRLLGAEFYIPGQDGSVGGERTGGLLMTRVA